MRCQYCSTALPSGHSKCPSRKCGRWNLARPKESIDNGTVLLSDATLSIETRIKTGLVDEVFGGGLGIAQTSVNLLGGEPGAGKTTLCLMLADIFCAEFPDKEALYIANEQAPAELKATATRLKLKHANRIRIVKAMGGVAHELGEIMLHYRPSVTFLDSVTMFAGEDSALAVVVCQRLKAYSVELNAPAIVVNHLTKGGEHAGLNKLQHAVDMTCLFDLLLDPDEDPTPSTPRRLMSVKNRNGPAPVTQYFAMTETGLVSITLETAMSLESSQGSIHNTETCGEDSEDSEDSEDNEDNEDNEDD